MGYKRRRKVDLRTASLPRLDALLTQANEHVTTLEALLAKHHAELGNVNVSRRLSEIDTRLTQIRSAWDLRLEATMKPKGILGKLIGIPGQPSEKDKSEFDSFRNETADLEKEQRQLELHDASTRRLEDSLKSARSWSLKVQRAMDRKRQKRDAVIELRAAAATSADSSRQVGAAVKRKLPRQPWCPYCGGPLGADAHADHIYPVAKGGRSTPRNMVYVCAACNQKKNNLTLAGFIRKYSLDRTVIESRLEELHKEF